MSPAEAVSTEALRFWLALHRAPLIGSRRFQALLARFPTPEAVFQAGPAQWRAAGLPEPAIAYLQAPDWRAVAGDLAWLEQPDHHCLTLGHPDYPRLLSEIADPPPILFVAGRPAALSLRQIAIVGSRNPSPSGCHTARDLAEGVASAGFGVASGLAVGIDAAAHRGALEGGGITVAVAGTGPDRVYPRQHAALAAEIIARGGALVSEFPPGTEPKAENFPRRNRIISGLALGTVVVEAAAKSGSLITARLALEQNRDVFAVPGSIYNPQSRGCNELIKDGAKLVQTANDILEEFAFGAAIIAPTSPAEAGPDTECPYPALLKCIAYDPTSVDTLVAATGFSAEIIASQLVLLELQGYVASTPGGGYIRLR